jgi:hypothetical protein
LIVTHKLLDYDENQYHSWLESFAKSGVVIVGSYREYYETKVLRGGQRRIDDYDKEHS